MVGASAGASVDLHASHSSDAIHHLPQGTIVVCAEVAVGTDGGQRVRISSPAGWLSASTLIAAKPAAPVKLDFDSFEKNHLKVAPGDRYGLDFPFTLDLLRTVGADFLTAAFRAAGTIASDNHVTAIVALEPLAVMGASESAFLTVTYARPEPGLNMELFVKFPPDKGVEYKYSLTAMSQGEIEIQNILNMEDLSFSTARCYFGDYCSGTSNYMLITERIGFAQSPIEPAYRKGYDHLIPHVEDHYHALTAALASLVAAHKTGALGYDIETIFPFGRAARDFDPISAPEINIDRLIDFVGRIAPQLFIPEASDPVFLQQWREDMLYGLLHKDRVNAYLHDDVDYVGLCHPNLNPDNAWFWRDDSGALHLGLIDWGGAGQMSIAQALSGMLMMPIPEMYQSLVRDVIKTFISVYADRGGVRLDPDTLLFHYKASVFSTAISTIISFVVDMLFQFSEEDYASMKDRHDSRLLDNGLYSAIVWIDNMLRDWADEITPGDACRFIVGQDEGGRATARSGLFS